ncbi:MAG: DUF5009 domain-containing protein, partial [Syntrophothermus sp.]
PGVTWVDLVFPFFLFSMGAAFPLALTKKLESGTPKWKLILQALQRGLLLAAFAIYIQHIKPYVISSNPDTSVWLTGLLGFVLLFPMLMRLPEKIQREIRWGIKTAGFAGAAILLSVLKYPDGSGFSVSRSDIIILVLANAAFFGTVIWICTKDNILLRLAVLPVYLAFRLTQDVQGSWNLMVWHATPAAWLYKLYYLQYLFIVIPGTIAGDMIWKWMNTSEIETMAGEKKSLKYISLILLLTAAIIINLWGLYTRALNFTVFADLLICAAGWYLLKKDENETERLYKSLFNWASYWLLLGICFEAFEGGIKKDKSTLSYYFVTSGLAVCAYIVFSVLTDIFRKNKYLSLLTGSGQNPMIAYIGGSNLIMPLLAITSAGSILNYMLINPWLGFIKGVIFTFLVALTAWIFSRKNHFWRT